MVGIRKTMFVKDTCYSYHPCETCPVLDTGAGVYSCWRRNDILSKNLIIYQPRMSKTQVVHCED